MHLCFQTGWRYAKELLCASTKIRCQCLILSCVLLSISVCSIAEARIDHDAVTSMYAIGALMNRFVDADHLQGLVANVASDDMQAVAGVGKTIGLPLQSYNDMTLAAIHEHGGPAILKLSNPDQLLAFAAVGAHNSLSMQNGVSVPLDNGELSKRFTGEAILISTTGEIMSNLQIDDPVYKFAQSGGASVVAFHVSVRNRGTNAIDVFVESTSCACTSAHLDTGSLQPGQTAFLTANMVSDGSGSKSAEVVIGTSDPGWPRIVVSLIATFAEGVRAVPNQIEIHTQYRRHQTRTLTISAPGQGASIMPAKLPRWVSVRRTGSERTATGGISEEYKVDISPPGLGASEGKIGFEIQGSKKGEIGVPIHLIVEPLIEVSPSTIFLSPCRSGDEVEQIVSVDSISNQVFRVASVINRSGLVKTTYLKEPAQKQILRLRIRVVGVAGKAFHDRITLTLADGERVDVPIVGMIKNDINGAAQQ